MLTGEPLSRSHKATGDISARVGTSLSFCFFPPRSPVPAVLDVALQAAVHSIVQGNWFPAWFLVLKPGAVAAWYCLWRVVICLQSWAGLELPPSPDTPCLRSWTYPSDPELFAVFLHKT